MPCFHPLQAYYGERKSNGKHRIVFNERDKELNLDLKLPCGQCIGCRLDRSRKWAMRCYFESFLYENNCFITLTFDDDHLPENRSIDVRDFQLFMKRLRKEFGNGIRFFHCGEYGDLNFRPHYHACLFNHDFPDKKIFKVCNGNRLYTSEVLQRLWPFGMSSIGDVTFESAAYVARYIVKKINGKDAQAHYELINYDTGEVFDRKPEYTTMSRRPGIGSAWFDKFHSDVYPKDFVTVKGRGKMKPPRYFDNLLQKYDSELMQQLKIKREAEMFDAIGNNSTERLLAREKVQLAKMKFLSRDL